MRLIRRERNRTTPSQASESCASVCKNAVTRGKKDKKNAILFRDSIFSCIDRLPVSQGVKFVRLAHTSCDMPFLCRMPAEGNAATGRRMPAESNAATGLLRMLRCMAERADQVVCRVICLDWR